MSDLKNLDKLDREFVIEQAIKLAGNKITCDQYLNSIDGLINKLLQKKANVASTGERQSNKPDVNASAFEKLKIALKALNDIYNFDRDMEFQYGDPGERAMRALEAIDMIDGF